MKITKHFEDWEFRVSRDYPELARRVTLPEPDLLKLFYICMMVLEPARDLYGLPITITSGKRTPQLNLAVKGVLSSDHLFCGESCAVDWTMKCREKLFHVYRWIYDESFYSVGEMILYFDKNWHPRFIHVSLPTSKHECAFMFDYNYGDRFEHIDLVPQDIYEKIFGEY